ncbi:hypothetical protein QOZ80_5AG0390970 [Eleusine coracana subsp. coracana]|nr:hypothetical protein QOZ80_5AG0390970 [Eleusine coracana subsp. coracana]
MIARGSPKLGRFLATTSATMKKKSPKCSRGKKAAGSPRVKQRASWNPALEKSLVHILLDYKDSHHRGENGWTSKGWNKMVKEFHEKNQARMQNGCKWNEKRCMIEGDDFMWNNLRVSFSRLKKFQNNKASFLLFDDLGLVYDGHLAEGTYNFTSMDNEEEVPLRQIYSLEDEMQELGGNQVHDLEDEDISLHRINEDVASEDASVERNRQPREASENASAERNGQPREASEDASVQRNVQQKRLAAALKNKEGKDGKKPKKTASIEGMMERYLEMRTKQAEEETASLEREKVIAQGADYSVKRCISVLSSMDVTKEEKAKAYAVFKNPENREVFLCACDHDLESALIWLRSEMV